MVDYEKVMDDRQKKVHENFGPNEYLGDPEHVRNLMDWVTFWRRNPGRFAETFFHIKLHLYQHIILFLMCIVPSIVIVAARSAAKSFIIAVFACVEAVLKPGARVVIASATKKQARLIVSEKIKKEILPNSPLLQMEIKEFRDNQSEIEVVFRNGSSVVVVAANDNARGYRATVMIYEEFRMIPKAIVDTVLSPFLYARQAPYILSGNYNQLLEEPKEVSISSAWYKSHWMWDTMKDAARDMAENKSSVLIAMDYSIALLHHIKTRSFLLKERRKLDSIAWAIEYENRMISENAHAYFSYEMLNQNRNLKRPFYPRRNDDVLSRVKNKFFIPKQQGEIRIISCDIASSEGKKNDNSVYSCMRLLPESKEYKSADTAGVHFEMKKGYRRQVPYMEAHNGWETTKQAIRIRQLFEDFQADYCVLDTRNIGIAVYDALAKVLYDEDRNVEYTPWCCMNNDKIRNRIVITGQDPVVFAVQASTELNSQIAVCMRATLQNKMIDFLLNHQEGLEEISRLVPDFGELGVDEQIFYETPYLETVALVNEMIGLDYTVMNQTGAIRIEEKSGARKDRYTSVSYANYFAALLEQDMLSDNSDYEFVTLVD